MDKKAKQTGKARRKPWKTMPIWLVVFDSVRIAASYFLALWIRFDCRLSLIPEQYMAAYLEFIAIAVIFSLIVLWKLHLYHSIWRFAVDRELLRCTAATLASFLFHSVTITLLYGAMPVSYYLFGVVMQFCATVGIRFCCRLAHLHADGLSVSNLQDVSVEDLLGRTPICVDLTQIFDYLKGKVILITGGAGSIGSELARQVAAQAPKQLILLDMYENTAYEVQLELKEKFPDLDLVVLIGSVRDSRKLDEVFSTYRPEIVFHAAAHKHVPLMEDSPCEAIKNNTIGTYKTAYAAMRYGCRRFVLISSDKAVNPTNIMGASKRLCEMVIQGFDQKIKAGKVHEIPSMFTHAADEFSGKHMDAALPEDVRTEFVAVRFGNVLGSNGSVVPLFQKQIAKGGPVTVTHPDIIRYFMTIPEAVSLVLQASTYARGGEIFVLDMGSAVKIDTLARNLIQLSGLRPDADIEIRYIGLRPGEKLYEEKLMNEEGMKKTPNDLIHIGSPIPFDVDAFFVKLNELMEAAYSNRSDIRDLVSQMHLTYYPAGEPGCENKGKAQEAQQKEMGAAIDKKSHGRWNVRPDAYVSAFFEKID